MFESLISDELLDRPVKHLGRVDVSVGVRRHTLRSDTLRDLAENGSVLRICDYDIAFQDCEKHHIVWGNCDAGNRPELWPLCDEAAILIENLNASIAPIGHQHPALRIQRERMGYIELTWS